MVHTLKDWDIHFKTHWTGNFTYSGSKSSISKQPWVFLLACLHVLLAGRFSSSSSFLGWQSLTKLHRRVC